MYTEYPIKNICRKLHHYDNCSLILSFVYFRLHLHKVILAEKMKNSDIFLSIFIDEFYIALDEYRTIRTIEAGETNTSLKS